jgi:DNA-binding MarR family transcriptional regulator
MKQDISKSRDNRRLAAGMKLKQAVRTSQTATDVFDEALTTFLGINRTDGRCLDIIDRLGRVSAGQLANESGLTTGAVTAVIDRLEAAGYVRRLRDELDRRKIWVEPTPAVQQINGHIFGIYARMSPALTEGYSDEQLQAVLEFLEISAHLNREMAAALGEHLRPAMDDVNERITRAARLERALEAGKDRMLADVAKLVARLRQAP